MLDTAKISQAWARNQVAAQGKEINEVCVVVLLDTVRPLASSVLLDTAVYYWTRPGYTVNERGRRRKVWFMES